MNTYIAKLVFTIGIDNQQPSQFDEQVRMIQARNMQDAFFKARTIGKKEEEVFTNKKNELVDWKFIDVTELYPLNELKDGEQLFGLTHETEDAASFIQFTREKSMVIQTNFLTFA